MSMISEFFSLLDWRDLFSAGESICRQDQYFIFPGNVVPFPKICSLMGLSVAFALTYLCIKMTLLGFGYLCYLLCYLSTCTNSEARVASQVAKFCSSCSCKKSEIICEKLIILQFWYFVNGGLCSNFYSNLSSLNLDGEISPAIGQLKVLLSM